MLVEDGNPHIGDSPPSPKRGMLLDQHLKELIASVGTALAECRKQAGELADDEPEGEPRVSNLADQSGASELAQQSKQVAEHSRDLNQELQSSKNSESVRSENLSRSLTDVEGLTTLVGVELGAKFAVLSWLKSLGKHLSNYPELLRKIGSALDIGADIAVPAWNRWSGVWHKIGLVVIEEVRGLGQDLKKQVDKWEEENGIGSLKDTDVDSILEGDEGAGEGHLSTRRDGDVRRHVLIDMAMRRNGTVKLRQGAIFDLVSDYGDHEETFRLLADRAVNDPSQGIRRYCINEMGNIEFNEKNYRDMHKTLIDVFEKEQISEIRSAVLKVITKNIAARRYNIDIGNFLRRLIYTPEHTTAQKTAAIRALRQYFQSDPETLTTILFAARRGSDGELRVRALSTIFGQFGDDDVTRDTVFSIAREQGDAGVRHAALNVIESHLHTWEGCYKLLASIEDNTRDAALRKRLRRLLSILEQK